MPGITTKGGFLYGRKSEIGTIAVPLTDRRGRFRRGLLIKAGALNTAPVYVGNSTVTADSNDETDGFELSAKESILAEVEDPRDVFVISKGTGQKVFWVGK